MTKEEFTLETIRCQLSYILESVGKIPKELPKPLEEPLPEFVTLDLAVRHKGGAALNTCKSKYYLQPCGGTNSHRVGGRKCWRREDVIEWLGVDDTELPKYLKRFEVTIRKY